MRVYLAITADIDNDGVALENERNNLSWRSLDRLPAFAEIIKKYRLPTTWFIRADPQLKDYYGSAAYLLEEHRSLWRNFAAGGDEIGWHPHLYARREDGSYEPERNDGRLVTALRATYSDLVRGGHRLTSVRIGEAAGSNAIMQTLAELGLRVDSSAIPGRVRNDDARQFDWGTTPNAPYWPSTVDYRVPGTPALGILEVPMTSVLVKAPYDPKPLLRYANLAYRPAIFATAFETWFARTAASEAVVTLIFHPEELMPSPNSHPLYALAKDALDENIHTLLNLAHRHGTEVVGKTMADVGSLFFPPGNVHVI